MKPPQVDDIVASVEDAVRRAYALGRADAMKRVVELAQSDDPSLRAVALLGPAEPRQPQALLDAPQPGMQQSAPDGPARSGHAAQQHAPDQPHADHHADHGALQAHEQAANHADARHEARQADAAASSQASAPAQSPAQSPERSSGSDPDRQPASVGGFLADFFYPLGSKKR